MSLRESEESAESWSEETFGQAQLGDRRRTRRLVQMAQVLTNRPAGKVTQVFQTDAERQGAYGLLENPKVTASAVALADHLHTARSVADEPFVFVGTDGSSFTITDRSHSKGTGRLGRSKSKVRGFEVQSAVVVRADGTPVGLCAQDYWIRGPKLVGRNRRKRKAHDKEIRFWNAAMAKTEACFLAEGSSCRPWFQCDRGGDAQAVLLEVAQKERLVTVRAAQNRRLASGPHRYLWDAMSHAPVVCTYPLTLPDRPGRPGRVALMVVRACEVTLRLRHPWTKTVREVTLWALQAEELGPPKGQSGLLWRLLTTWPVATEEDACLVVYGYTQRWRVEEFHRTWKKGACHLEDSELRSAEAIQKWAVLLASVAMRALRLSYRVREAPHAPATCEFTPEEVEAVIVLKRPKGVSRSDVPTLEQVVLWVAELGGYTGKHSGGPPGPTVLARGLKEVVVAAKTIAHLKAPTM